MDPCPICLENVDYDIEKPYKCNHTYHKKCIETLGNYYFHNQNKCMLCMAESKPSTKNYTFNNMLIGERYFDVNYYLKKWENKNCFDNNHNFHLETIGDWDFRNGDMQFDYKYMLIQCKQCNKDIILK